MKKVDAGPPPRGIDQIMEKELEFMKGIIDPYIQNNFFSAAQIAVHTGDKLHSIAMGEADRLSLFDTASLTKFVLNYLLVRACYEKEISLDSPIYLFLPEFNSEGLRGQITIKHLLTFTVNFKTEMNFKNLERIRGEVGSKNAKPKTEKYGQEIIDELMTAPVRSTPGSEFKYTNAASIIAALVLDAIGGSKNHHSIRSFVGEMANPVGGVDTAGGFTIDQTPVECISTGTCDIRGELSGVIHDPTTYILGIRGAAGIFANAQSMAKVVSYISRDYQRMGYEVGNVLDARVTGVSFGYGMGFDLIPPEMFPNIKDMTVSGYFSAYPGPFVFFNREHNLSIAVMANFRSHNGVRLVPGFEVSQFRTQVMQSIVPKFI